MTHSSYKNVHQERDVKQLIMNKIHKMNVAKIFLKEDENYSTTAAPVAAPSLDYSQESLRKISRDTLQAM